MTEQDKGISLEEYFIQRLRRMAELQREKYHRLNAEGKCLVLSGITSTFHDLKLLGRDDEARKIIAGLSFGSRLSGDVGSSDFDI